MKEIVIMSVFIASKIGMAWLAYWAVFNRVKNSGWFVFLAIVYAMGTSLKVD
ncbi:BioY family protein [Neisseria dumasiana]|uniref:BioY family protein n=1 Tax=Neisseria dumasiana TaxID=1931275 RepID=UPI001FD2FFCD|nr:BioY family protein [Neisseria dumasiana]